VLYLSAEDGIYLTMDRGKSWQKLSGANFPNIRVDEITIHPRENAMLIATHGRGIWILDHLEPIQEMAAAKAASEDAKLFSPGQALQWRQWDDRNDEFWGHQFWVGENPPTQAVIQMYFKKAVSDAKLHITDATGKQVRDLPIPGNRNGAGIQTVCWDMRVDSITAGGPAAAPGGGAAGPGGAGAAAAAAAQGGRGGGGGAGGGRGGGGNNVPQPDAGYMPSNPCGGAGGGGGRGGGGGGGAAAGPMVLPGTYNVALVVGGKTIETKPLKIVGDPELQMDANRKHATEVAMDLHEIQKKGQTAADALTSVDTQMAELATKVKESKAPDAVKAQFDAFAKEFDSVKAKFGVGAPAAGGGGRGGGRGGAAGAAGAAAAGAAGAGAAAAGAAGAAQPAIDQALLAQFGGGGRGGGAPDPNNVLGRIGSLKGDLMGFGDGVSDSQLKAYTELKAAMPKALADANAVLVKAMTVSQALKKYDLNLTVPAPIK
jgi:hypothetical protein